MTYEEALKILDTIPTIGEQVDALELAIEAFEKQIKYRWHDLIRDKDDLPADGETVEVLYEYYHFKAEAVLPEYGHARYYHGSKFWGGDASNGSQLKVLAWRYIEPVEEEADA